ncbi:MAG: EamA family transporter [Gaiellaceae bacterium]
MLVLLGALALGRLPSAAEAAGVVVRRGRAPRPRASREHPARRRDRRTHRRLHDRDDAGIEHAGPIAYLELVLVPVALAALLLVPRDRLRAALEQAPAAPVAAVRETSVVIAVALAAVFLRERVTRSRLAGAIVVAAGVALLSF